MGCILSDFCCTCYPICGPAPWNPKRDSPKRFWRRPVVCVAGLASSALERADFQEEGCKDWLGCRKYHTSYCSVSALAWDGRYTLNGLKLRLVKGELSSGEEVVCTDNLQGIHIRPVEGTQGITSLNPGEGIPIPVWSGSIRTLEFRHNYHNMAYDWRRWGDEVYAEKVVAKFQKLVATDRKGRGKVAVIGHSMGASVVLYCVSVLGAEWARSHIDKLILVGPAHMGSPSMLWSFAHGPVNATHAMMAAPQFIDEMVNDVTATWACMVAEVPTKVGKEYPWPKDTVFAKTPTRTYTLDDMGKFLDDVQASTGNREFGPCLWPGVQRMAQKITTPAVPVYLVYSDGVDTPAEATYDDENLGGPPTISQFVPGDGTIVADSVVRVAQAWEADGGDIKLVKVQGAVSHKELISCGEMVGLLKQWL